MREFNKPRTRRDKQQQKQANNRIGKIKAREIERQPTKQKAAAAVHREKKEQPIAIQSFLWPVID